MGSGEAALTALIRPGTGIWAHRSRRAGQLATLWPFAADVLAYFGRLTIAQERVWRALEPAAPADPAAARLERFAAAFANDLHPAAPAPLRGALAPWRDGSDASQEMVAAHLAGAWAERAEAGDGDSAALLLARALLVPYAMARPAPPPAPAPASPCHLCPACGCPPIASVLHEDVEAAARRRSLVCSLCASTWSFPRVLCPHCEDERPEALPRLAADEIPWLRIEACDSCGRYLKAIELARDPDADPVADELGALPLDAIARQRGYRKIAPNLLGV